eukprot:4464559-Pyramimonas_sp.AAC.2
MATEEGWTMMITWCMTKGEGRGDTRRVEDRGGSDERDGRTRTAEEGRRGGPARALLHLLAGVIMRTRVCAYVYACAYGYRIFRCGF